MNKQHNINICDKNIKWNKGSPLTCGDKLIGIFIGLIDGNKCNIINGKCEENVNSYDVYSVYIYICPYLTWMSKYISDIQNTPSHCNKFDQLIDYQKYIIFLILISVLSSIFMTVFLHFNKYDNNNNNRNRRNNNNRNKQ